MEFREPLTINFPLLMGFQGPLTINFPFKILKYESTGVLENVYYQYMVSWHNRRGPNICYEQQKSRLAHAMARTGIFKLDFIAFAREKAQYCCSFGLALHLLQIRAKIPIQLQSITKQLQIQSCVLSLPCHILLNCCLFQNLASKDQTM